MSEASDPWTYADDLLKQIKTPVFPARDFLLSDFGAVADGKTSNTQAFGTAIEACSRAGGGRVLVPAGNYLSGPIYLKSGVNLHLQEGACILFSTRADDYLPLVHTRWEGVELLNYKPLIYAFEEKNIAITGKGLLDGQASSENWWSWRGDKQWGWQQGMPSQNSQGSRDRLFEMGEQGLPLAQRQFGRGHYLRPSFIQFYRCETILLQDFRLINSPMWALHPVLSSNISIRAVTVDSLGPNVDGCNPDSCSKVIIEDCHFNVLHDGIALKSGRNADGRRIAVPTEGVLVRNSTFGAGHGAIVVGSETSGGIRNIYVENCQMLGPGLCRALRIKTSSGRGGLIEQLYLRNIKVAQLSEQVVHICMLYEERGHYYPVIRNIEIRNWIIEDGGKLGLLLEAYPESPIQNMLLHNFTVNKVQECYRFQHVENIFFEEVSMNAQKIVYGY